ncbi:MAG: TOBE domain-containing protein [Alphaproteobacteria bacterium]|nr:TOBE domain-containing protein [Alphaproteobacteria bacterium]
MAEFVERNNILSGISRGDAIETALGTFPATGLPAQGRPATLVIAADLVEISQAPRDGAIPCSLISEEFVGATVTLFLEAADGTELKVQVPERALGELNQQAGSRYHLSWPADAGHVLTET